MQDNTKQAQPKRPSPIAAQRCKSCGAAILFITTPSATQAPVNLHPSWGTVVWLSQGDGSWKLGEGHGYTSHFSTCPQGNSHRKR